MAIPVSWIRARRVGLSLAAFALGIVSTQGCEPAKAGCDRCDGETHYCHVSITDGPNVETCEPLPSACEPDDCACIDEEACQGGEGIPQSCEEVDGVLVLECVEG